VRIAQFIDTDTQGGAETIVVDLCRELSAHGHDSLLLHFGSPYLDEHCRRHGLEQRVVPGHALYKSIKTLPHFALVLRRFLREQGVELLHSHLFGPITGAALAARLAGIPHVGTLHDVYVVAERPARARLLQLAGLLGTRLVAVSDHMARFYRSQARFGTHTLRTIHNGARLTQPPRDPALRAALGLSEQDLAVICVGRLVPLKRHDQLLQAFAAVRTQRPVKLLLAGDGPLRAQLETLALTLGIADRVRFLGNRTDVPALLAASDVFALVSETEGLSCSLLEAMAAGLPALATRVGGNPELVADGTSGYLVEVGDVRAMRERLQALLDDDRARAAMGREARHRAEQRFSVDTMMRAYLQLYARLGPRPSHAAVEVEARRQPERPG